MTEKLKSLLHDQAATVDFAAPDLDAITASGDRRVRRRRGAGLVGGLAALAVVGGLVVGSPGGDGDDDVRVADVPFPASSLSWAHGSTLHAGGTEREVGVGIEAYVSTEAGYVLVDADGAVWSYLAGRVERVGTTAAERPRLVGDADGSLVGWVDPTADRPAFVVLDTGSGTVSTLPAETRAGMGALADEKDPAYFYAVDGRTAYLRDQRGAVGLDVDTGEVVWRDESARNGFDLIAVEDGVIARDGGDRGTVLERPDGPVVLQGRYASLAAFSPSGRWITLDADEPEVFDVATGRGVPIDIGSRVFGTGFGWLDDTTLVAIAAQDESGPVEILTCTLPAGTCTQEAEFGGFEEFATDYRLALGEGFDD